MQTSAVTDIETGRPIPRGRRGAPPRPRRAAKGRKDAEKQETVIELAVLTDRAEELIRLHKASRLAAEEYGEAVKAAAEKSGLLASVVRSYITARAGEDYPEKKRKVEQLALVFEECAG